MDSGAAVESQEGAMPAAVALDFTDGEVYPSPSRIPRRIQRRFRHSRSRGRTSMEDIEAKLRDADLRRKVFGSGKLNYLVTFRGFGVVFNFPFFLFCLGFHLR